MYLTCTVLLGFVLDCLLGDPNTGLHPACLIGRLVSRTEKILRRLFPKTRRGETVAGVLLCSAYPTLMPATGSMPGIKAFTAAVFGGIGSIPGAMLGGLVLGLVETFTKGYISTQFSDAVVFLVLIVVLLVKPAGLLGKNIQEKV